jgi:hypothetical protein
MIYDDEDSFSQTVIDVNDGDISTESSDADAVLLNAATGYAWKFGEEAKTAVRLQGGFAIVTSSERSIANCSNCSTEDIDIGGGIFVRATLLQSFESWSMGVFVQQYLNGDINNAFGISISSAF